MFSLSPRILFIVPSAPWNIHRRQKIRDSQLYQFVRDPSNSASLLFYTGAQHEHETMGTVMEHAIQEETRMYHDVIRIHFLDVYQNIRLKHVAMLKWVCTFCRHVGYVIRVDDDFVVDPRSLVKSITRVAVKYDNFIVGKVQDVPGVERRNVSKYYVSREEYAPDLFPPFALGGLLGYPYRTVALLYQAALRVTPLWLDDVYITGLCRERINATLLHDEEFITSFVHTGKEVI